MVLILAQQRPYSILSTLQCLFNCITFFLKHSTNKPPSKPSGQSYLHTTRSYCTFALTAETAQTNREQIFHTAL